MEIIFNPAKDEINRRKHHVSLSLASKIDWSEVWFEVDVRYDYQEVREIGYALVGDRLYCVVYTQRGETMHIISLRKANRREVKRYVDET
ncbi:MAG: BrnT family toxin [Castellaniella sp.]|uniref:BrnT family toxin n=1 Tax=Castellaniella sp. TaxID=1955812 RepID=UPI003C774622